MSTARSVQGERTFRTDYLNRTELDLQMTKEDMLRANVTAMIKQLGVEAQIHEGKANVRALWRLWLSIIANIELGLELVVEQVMERQLEQEQLTAGRES